MSGSEIRGGCHCGNITWRYRTARSPQDLSPRRCDCPFCLRLDAIWSSDARGELDIFVADRDRLSGYRFAHRTVDFLFCSVCGILPAAVLQSGAGHRGIVNLRTSDIDWSTLPVTSASYGAETREQRILRRTAGWTPMTTWQALIQED